MRFSTIQRYIKSALHDYSADVCKDGYAALLRVSCAVELADVVRQYWADLNHALWPVFSQLLQKYYPECREEFVQCGICYNEDAERGLCVVDEHVRRSIILSGNAAAEVHGSASVKVCDTASADLHDTSHAVASGQSRVTSWDQSSVQATQHSTIRAFGSSHVVADGAVSIHLSDDSTIQDIRSYRIYDNRISYTHSHLHTLTS